MDASGSPFSAWENFYVIIGSSAGALIGLQFVVIALIAEAKRPSSTKEIDAFSTPTILHFGAVLVVSLIVSAPWPSLSLAGLAIGICGSAGLVYVGIVIRRARGQTGYELVWEDWLWHAVLPLVAYAVLVVAALTLRRWPLASQFAVAGSASILLFIGIHNAWDNASYITVVHNPAPIQPPEPR